MDDLRRAILTIGHSTHPWERFVSLLRGADVTAIADVRTAPYSRYAPHFSREELRERLRGEGIAYVFLGKELGGRPASHAFYRDGVADYEKMAKTDVFAAGLQRVIEGADRYHIALMCSEQDPLECHRCLLVGRALATYGVAVAHVLADGAVQPHLDAEERLLRLRGRAADDLLSPREDRLAMAYREQEARVAFTEADALPTQSAAAG